MQDYKKFLLLTAGLAVLAAGGVLISKYAKKPAAPAPPKGIVIETPQANSEISFPLTIRGYITGDDNWTPFEAQAGTVQAFDSDGNPLSAIQPLQGGENWMTFPSYFTAAIYKEDLFGEIRTAGGYLLFKNDNASGEPERNREFRLPVKFAK